MTADAQCPDVFFSLSFHSAFIKYCGGKDCSFVAVAWHSKASIPTVENTNARACRALASLDRFADGLTWILQDSPSTVRKQRLSAARMSREPSIGVPPSSFERFFTRDALVFWPVARYQAFKVYRDLSCPKDSKPKVIYPA